MQRTGFLFLSVLLFASCQSQSRIFTSAGVLPEQTWTAEEKSKSMAVHTLRKTPEASFHIINLQGAEKLHTHDTHDLVVSMLSGKARITIDNQSYVMMPGDILEVPKGAKHKADNLDRNGSQVYAVFTPPFDGKDYREVEDAE